MPERRVPDGLHPNLIDLLPKRLLGLLIGHQLQRLQSFLLPFRHWHLRCLRRVLRYLPHLIIELQDLSLRLLPPRDHLYFDLSVR
jgi:hypothetical protein